MICLACGHENLEGLDSCENCGADLRTVDIPLGAVDIPQVAEPFESHMAAPLASLDTPRAEAVSPELAVAEAIGRMRGGAADCLLIGAGGQLAGIFTERDAVVKLAGRPLVGLTVGDAMTADPVVLRVDDTIAVAIHTMAVGGFRHIPIVDLSGAPIGVVAAADVFRYVLSVA